MKVDNRLSRAQRLTRSSQIREAYEQRNSFVGRLMVLYVRQGDDASQRLGVVSSKKVGGAVQRNRARRRLRSAYRLCRPYLSGDTDAVFVARGYLLRAEWTQVVSEMLYLANKAGLLSKENKRIARDEILSNESAG